MNCVPMESLREQAREALTREFAESSLLRLSEDEEARAWAIILEVVERENDRRVRSRRPELPSEARAEAARSLFDDFFRLGPLQPHLEAEGVEDVIVNAPNRGFLIASGGEKRGFDPGFSSDDEIRALLSRVVARAGGRLDDASPEVSVCLPGEARLQAFLPPLSRHVCLTVRIHRMVADAVSDLIALGTLPKGAARFLEGAVAAGANILVSGGTGSGKTTTLNCLGSAIPGEERVVTIEETRELRLEELLPDCVALVARPANTEGVGEISIRHLVRQALRMRPTRIVVGEVRGPEALDMISAMNTGHQGSMGTIHADNARQALSKLRTYMLMAEERITAEVAAEMIADTVDLVVQQQLDRKSATRAVVQIAEVAGLEAGCLLTNDLFLLQDGVVTATGVRARNADLELALFDACLDGVSGSGV